MKIVYKKIVAIALFALILFGTVSHAVPVKASPGDVQRKRSIPYSVLFAGATYSTGEYSMEDANGEIRTAYCIEANKKALGSGNYNYEEIDYSTYPLLIKVLAYGYNGPFDITGNYFDTPEERYVATHIAASYAFNTIALGHEDFTGIPEPARENFMAVLGDFVRECNGYDLGDGRVTVARGAKDEQGVAYISYWEEKEDFLNVEITVEKKDKERGYSHSGLQGAAYTLYRTEADYTTITGTLETEHVSLNGDGGAQMPTIGGGVQKGEYKAVFKTKLKAGYYIIRETEAPPGFQLDETTFRFRVFRENGRLRLESLDGFVGTVSGGVAEVTSMETPARRKFAFTKKSTTGESLAGAGFQVWREEEILKAADGSIGGGRRYFYDFSAAAPIVITEDGGDMLVTDEAGYAQSCPVPIGRYVVKEVMVPAGFYPVEFPNPFDFSEMVDYFVVELIQGESDVYYYGEVTDRPVEARLRIVKKDEETGVNILSADTAFQIYDVKNGTYVEQSGSRIFCTDETGILLLREAIRGGEYRIEEVIPPSDHYILGESITIVLDKDLDQSELDENGIPIITVDFPNTPIRGGIEATKMGESLSRFVDGSFVWEEKGLRGATFEVFAAEDLFYDDLRAEEDNPAAKKVRYKEGELVGSFVTEENGKGAIEGLQVGKYNVVELEAPKGYVRDDTPIPVEITKQDETVGIVVEKRTVYNEKNSLQIKVCKKDSVDGIPLAGARFGLFAKEAIRNYAGEIICDKGSLICEAVTGESGEAVFETDLPFASYVVRELQAPAGYIKTDKEWIVEAKNEDVLSGDHTAYYTEEFTNKPIKAYLRVIKKDSETGNPILSSKTAFKIFDVKNKAFLVQNGEEVFHTDENGVLHLKEPLAGGIYRIDEADTPSDHYVKGTSVTITIDEEIAGNGEWDEIPVYTVEFMNTPIQGSVEVTKVGETLTGYDSGTFIWEQIGLPGAEFDVIVAETIYYDDLRNDEETPGEKEVRYEKGRVIGKIVTGEDGVGRLDHLPVGAYELVETVAPEGYVLLDTPIPFQIRKKNDVTSAVLMPVCVYNDLQKLEMDVYKQSEETHEPLEGAVFALYAGEDIVNHKQEILVADGELICTAESDKLGHVEFGSRYPVAVYEIKETKAPKGYKRTTECWEINEETMQGTETGNYSFTQIVYNQKPPREDKPEEPSYFGNLKLVMGATDWKSSNYRTEDSGEEGYSILLTGGQDKEEGSAQGKKDFSVIAFGILLFCGGIIALIVKRKRAGRSKE